MTVTELIDHNYPAGTLRREIFLRHSRSVAALALELNERLPEPLDPGLVEDAAMLHDIGIVKTNAPGIGCEGTEPYIMHGPLGAAMIREASLDERLARVAERHTGTGLDAVAVERLGLPAPPDGSGDYLPHSMLEKLVCYADKFYSKSGDMQRRSLKQARVSLARYGGDTLARFDALTALFGAPSPEPR